MAEFCLECWNELNETNDSPRKYIISKDLDLCEGCGEWKKVIVTERKYYYYRKFRYFILPFKIIHKAIYFFYRLLILPYLFYINNKNTPNNS